MLLHTVNKSPFEKNALESCLNLSKAGSGVFLLEDGVYAAMKGTVWADKVTTALSDKKVYVLTPDLAARGMNTDNVIDGIEMVDYAGFVDLVAEYSATQAWL
ncbi:sulfurtransferase complex subunit TusB [Candidatus Albibeggiatoa sp. nov. NOAA]|uniref:sulfurtransferase complex subunit TusB n=1 Tax=Candidatus Albibeggiatoa sp. nov. NOAA TaxID=3162724 RepID=UPI00330201BD|nr:sulfurtransferase complex subunit TusB [Thiotrichaceae bacterium]